MNPQKIACMHCVSPQKIFTIGEGHRIAVMGEQSPWAYKLFPEICQAKSRDDFSPEQLKEMGVDLVFYSPGMHKEKPFSDVGLPTVCSFSGEKRAVTVDQFFESFEGQVALFGDILGPQARERADNYNRVFERKAREVFAITSKIDPGKRPKVYFGGKRNDLTSTQGNTSYMHWVVSIAGGDYLPAALQGDYATAEAEQIKAWNPEFIFLSAYSDSTNFVTQAPEWAELDAVKNKRVYRIPRGVFAWDHASSEAPLLMLYMAKMLHPGLFEDCNLCVEVRAFYAEAYEKTITNQDAERILTFLPPM